MGIRIKRTRTGLQGSVEKGCEIGVDVQIGFRNFVEARLVSECSLEGDSSSLLDTKDK